MPRRLLLDNDFIIKISSLDLVEELLALPLVRDGELRHLDALPYMIRKGCFKNRTAEGLQRALEWVGTFPCIEALAPQAIDRIPHLPGIDPGERLLLGSVLEIVESSIFTGDKRCITAIGGLPAGLQNAFRGRLLCLEAAVRAILTHEDFDHVVSKVRSGLSCDRTMRSIFGSSADTNKESVDEGFASYLSDIASKPGGSLLMGWEALL
jgi:hypothetical protein